MPAPVLMSPLAWRLIAVGGVALAGAVMRASRAPSSVVRDDMLDETPDGVSVRRESVDRAEQATALGRWRRTIRLGTRGPGVEIDLSGMVRGRVRPVRRGGT
ncbi:MAG: hypothetical protein AAF661_12975 [Pseudomonadota bacterium]